MFVGGGATAIHFIAVFVEPGFEVDVNILGVQLVHVVCDQLSFGIVPGAGPDAIACIDAVCDLQAATGSVDDRAVAEVGRKGLWRTHCGGERVAMGVCPFKSAEVGAIALADAGDEEGHLFNVSRLRRYRGPEGGQRYRRRHKRIRETFGHG